MDTAGVCQCLGMRMSGADVAPWTASTLPALFLMWTEMMVAMMLPSAAPMILIFSRLATQRSAQGRSFVPTGLFVLGYLAIWTCFSLIAAVAQWFLHGFALLSPEMRTTSPILGGILICAAGVFQFTPLKRCCLDFCRSPLTFLLTEWREGRGGAVRMGIKHGIFCAGCCWVLMALLFVAGVMNLVWVAVLSLLVLGEKLAPKSWHLAQIVGVFLLLWGGWILAPVTLGGGLNQA